MGHSHVPGMGGSLESSRTAVTRTGRVTSGEGVKGASKIGVKGASKIELRLERELLRVQSVFM